MRWVGAAAVERVGRRQVAAAVGHDHHRREVELPSGGAVAVEPHQPLGRLVDIGGEVAGLPEIAGAGIGGVERELRRHQRDVLAGLGDLARHGLAHHHVALERGALAVEIEHDQHRPLRIEAGRQVEQRAAVAVGRLLPVDVAAQAGMAALVAVLHVEEGLPGAGIDAAIGEGRGVEGDELGLALFQRLRPERLGRRRRLLDRLFGRLLCRAGMRGGRHQESPQQQRPPLHAAAGRPAPTLWERSGISTEKKAGKATR